MSNRRLPPLNALRAFEAAARLGSFKRAAAEANVTHGAISRHVQGLEDWLAAKLFVRHNRRVTLTEAGAAYLAEIGPALDRIAAATADYGVARPRRALHVSTLSTFALHWLLPRLNDFQARHTGVQVQVSTASTGVDAAEACDAVIRLGPDTFEGFRTVPFLSERRVPVCSPALLRKLPLRTPDDLRRHTLLHSSSQPRIWGRWLALAGTPDLQPAGSLVFDHFYLALQGAMAGLGVAMGPTALIEKDVAAHRLVLPFPDLTLPARSYCLYLPADRADDPLVRDFTAWLTAEGARAADVAAAIGKRRRKSA